VQGIPAAENAGICVCDDAGEFAAAVVEQLRADSGVAARGRRFVLERHAWSTQVDAVAELLLHSDRASAGALARRYVAV
jgi:hypothetical protein